MGHGYLNRWPFCLYPTINDLCAGTYSSPRLFHKDFLRLSRVEGAPQETLGVLGLVAMLPPADRASHLCVLGLGFQLCSKET